ncbi:hypothetical protein HZA57_10255 [Candidatus Poribacteria bacterium]|nr:hypothetical protein [Candidatus Poribacteria bacterium]
MKHELDLGPLGVPFRRVCVLAVSLLVLGAMTYRYRFVVIDDPYISFRYAKNLAAGAGLVFNPGEAVEGYSNFLWTLVASAVIRAGLAPLGVMRLLGFLCTTGMLALFSIGIRGRWRSEDGRPFGSAPFAALLLASCYPVAVWSSGGLETASYAALCLSSVLLTARATSRPGRFTPFTLAAVLTAAALSRPEGAMIAALPALALLLSRGSGRKALGMALGCFAAAYLLYSGWRLATFGTLVPNTVSAKVGGNPFSTAMHGLDYLRAYFIGAPVLLLGLALPAVRRIRALERKNLNPVELDWVASLGVVFSALQLFFVVLVGGDWMPGMRFLVPMLPVLCLLASLTIEHFPRFVALTMCGFLIFASPIEARREKIGGARLLEWGRRNANGSLLLQPLVFIGQDLRAMTRPGDTIALTEAGAIPYYCERPVIDMFGLTDPEIAAAGGSLHESFDARSVLDRAPEYILLGCIELEGKGLVAVWAPDQQILASPEFAANYKEVRRWPRLFMIDATLKGHPGFMVLFRRFQAPPRG